MPDVEPRTDRALIEARSLVRQSGGRRLLRETSFVLKAGDRWTIVGPSGSGKTVLLRAVSLLDPVQSGEVLFHGRPVNDADAPSYRSRVIHLAQRPAMVNGSVRDNLLRPFQLQAHADKRFDEPALLERLHALERDAKFLDQSVGEISGGELQIVAFLRALQLAPEVLLLDEPTASMDPQSARVVETWVNDWFASGTRACVWVTHAREEVRRTGDRLWRMTEGVLTPGGEA